MNDIIKCPACGGDMKLLTHSQLHVNYISGCMPPEFIDKIDKIDKSDKIFDIPWTTRKYRQENELRPDNPQIRITDLNVPKDDTWFTCGLCNSDFDENLKLYKEEIQ